MTPRVIPDMPMASYVADDHADAPTLNASVAHILLTRSPFHAWYAHPKLNPAWEPEYETKWDIGTAAHGALLEGRGPKDWYIVRDVDGVPFEDYKKPAARVIRDAARADGKLPLLAKHAAIIRPMATNARAKLAECPDLDGVTSVMEAETTCVWRQGDAILRCRPDWLSLDRKLIVSYKTTGASASPDEFMRTILHQGYALQAAFELAAIKAAFGVDAHYVWLVGEVDPPHAVSLLGMTPGVFDYAQDRLTRAVRIWADCLASNLWPGYPDGAQYVDLPRWADVAWQHEIERGNV
jgi:hypothetical protein